MFPLVVKSPPPTGRIGQRWEATQAPTWGTAPVGRAPLAFAGGSASSFLSLPGGPQSDKSRGCGGSAPTWYPFSAFHLTDQIAEHFTLTCSLDNDHRLHQS